MVISVSLVLFCLAVLLTGHMWLSAAAACSEFVLFGLLGGRQALSMRERWRRFLLTLGTEFFLAAPVAALWFQRVCSVLVRHHPFGERALYVGLSTGIFALVVALGGVLLGATCLTSLVKLQPLPDLSQFSLLRRLGVMGTHRNT